VYDMPPAEPCAGGPAMVVAWPDGLLGRGKERIRRKQPSRQGSRMRVTQQSTLPMDLWLAAIVLLLQQGQLDCGAHIRV
jgi:hypothetical protein